MQKLNIKILILITLVLIIFISINLIITLLLIPKFNQYGDLLINLDFNENKDLKSYLNGFNNLSFKYSKKNVFIKELVGNNETAALILDNKGKEEFIHIIFNNNNYDYLKFEAKVRFENIKKTNKKFPKILIFIEDETGKFYWNHPYQYVVKNFYTIFKWEKLEDIYHVPSFAKKIHLVISNNSISGKMICDDIKLTPYKINSTYKFYRLILFIILFVIIIIILFIFRKYILQFYKQIIILFIIITGVLSPKIYLYRLVLYLNFNELLIQKAGHLFLFSLLSFIIFINKKYFIYKDNKQFTLLLIIELLLIAVLTEILQFFTFSRQMNFIDILIDSAGILFGILIGYIYLYNLNFIFKK